jgi:hypothetical protein
MLACTPALLLRAVPMLDEDTIATLFPSEQLCVFRDPATGAGPERVNLRRGAHLSGSMNRKGRCHARFLQEQVG